MKKHIFGYANLMLEFMQVEHGTESTMDKYLNLSSLLPGLLHTLEHALFLYQPKIRRMQPICSSRIMKEVMEALTSELNTIMPSLERGMLRKRYFVGRKQQETIFFPIFAGNSLQGVLVASNLSNELRKELKSKDFFSCLDCFGYALQGIAANSQVNRLTYTDSLTGLSDERILRNDLTKCFQDGRYKSYVFVLVKMNDLKIYNDKYGYSQGNKVLQIVANELQDSVLEQENVYHKYGNQFALLLKCDHRVAYKRMRKIADSVIHNDSLKDKTRHLISIGLVDMAKLLPLELDVDVLYRYALCAQRQSTETGIFIYSKVNVDQKAKSDVSLYNTKNSKHSFSEKKEDVVNNAMKENQQEQSSSVKNNDIVKYEIYDLLNIMSL